ncbi:MAG TPA: UxaA family hydrolase [Solirubrobacteraceae bacterium]|nr:UxaA family hydrolase [Solirubrobacteraceae bacterium]
MTGTITAGARVLILDQADNVAVALTDLPRGEVVATSGDGVVVATVEPIQAAHKLAIRPIAAGEAVIKYGEAIGLAHAAIAAGAHVHIHNVSSGRLPGPHR